LYKIQKSYNRLCLALDHTKANSNPTKTGSDIVEKLLTYLCDDLNTSGMFGVIFENLSTLSNGEKLAVKNFLEQVLGLSMVYIPEKQAELTPEIKNLIELRTQARTNKDWVTADRLREELNKLGYIIQDK